MSYIHNAWYCAGFAQQLAESPLAIRILDVPIVIYRTAGGQPAALHDRCPHRFAPLSRGKVVGDDIECAYHGLRFGATGSCTVNPHGTHALPRQARVRTYPIVERDTLLWIWMGAADAVAPDRVPDFNGFFGLPARTIVRGYYTLQAHYELVLDNLMDLSHAPFLHAGTLSDGASDANVLRVETEHRGDEVLARHLMDDVPPTPQFRPFWNAASGRGDFRANMHWQAPGTLRLDVGICERGQPPDTGPNLHFAHLITPATLRTTHYFWAAARNFAVASDAVSRALQADIQRAFVTQDEPMIEAVQERMGNDDLFALDPVLLRGDQAAVLVRRALARLRATDQSAVT